jgi:hypothetical protein
MRFDAIRAWNKMCDARVLQRQKITEMYVSTAILCTLCHIFALAAQGLLSIFSVAPGFA